LYVTGTGAIPGGGTGRVGDAFVARFAPDLSPNRRASPAADGSTLWPYMVVLVVVLGVAVLAVRRSRQRRRASRRL
ncbi:MAG: hypothetical protein ACRDHO_15515, partial [Actinomycetota bacterium]